MSKEILVILFFAGTFLATLVVTILFCRHRLAIRKKSFYSIAFLSTLTVNMVFSFGMMIAGRIYAEGLRMFSSEAWQGIHSFSSLLFDVLLLGFFGILFCIFPALAVAYYYEKRSKNNEEGMDSQAT